MFKTSLNFFLFKVIFFFERFKSNCLKKKIKKIDDIELNNFKNFIKNKNFTTFWFLNNFKLFSFFLPKNEKEIFNYLEIGSFEGMSALFVANKYKDSNIVCVDTWSMSLNKSQILDFDFQEIEKNFDKNLIGLNLLKIKDTSRNAYSKILKFKYNYDYIYIDGSHDGEDIYFDATQSFKILKKGGIMIFDDISTIDRNLNLQAFQAFEKFYKENKKNIRVLYLKRLAVIKKVI